MNANIETCCPACGGAESTILETIDLLEQHTHYAPDNSAHQVKLASAARVSSESYRMCRCSSCQLEFAFPLVSPSPDWYYLAYQILKLYPTTRWEYGAVQSALGPKARVLDIGCGNGEFLLHCREAGIKARGVDFSSSAVADCVGRGLDATTFDLGAAEIPGCGDITDFVAFHLLEHLSAPDEFLRVLGRCAAQGSKLWIAVPSPNRPSRLFGERDFLDQPPHHMTRWTAAAFAKLAERTGWSLRQTIMEPISARTAVWSTTIRSPQYNTLITKESGRLFETLVRLALTPLAVADWALRRRTMSGFTLLVQCIRP